MAGFTGKIYVFCHIKKVSVSGKLANSHILITTYMVVYSVSVVHLQLALATNKLRQHVHPNKTTMTFLTKVIINRGIHSVLEFLLDH